MIGFNKGVLLTNSIISPCRLILNWISCTSVIPIGASDVDPEQVTLSAVVTVNEHGIAQSGISMVL